MRPATNKRLPGASVARATPARTAVAVTIGLLCALGLVLTGCGKPVPFSRDGRPGGPYVMTLSADAGQLEAEQPVLLTTTLRHAKNNAPVQNLQIQHERVVHNFIVNLDFTSFAHIHHEDFAELDAAALEQARLSFPYTFPRPGRYRMVSQFTHAERTWTKHFDVPVGEAAAAAPVVDLQRRQQVGEISAQLESAPENPVAGFETSLALVLTRNDAPVTDLALLLGSEVHVAVWRLDGTLFGHTHSYTQHMAQMLGAMHDPAVDAKARARAMQTMMIRMMAMPATLEFPGPRVPVHYVFPEPGTYVLFFHCAPGGVATVFRFMLEVGDAGSGDDT